MTINNMTILINFVTVTLCDDTKMNIHDALPTNPLTRPTEKNNDGGINDCGINHGGVNHTSTANATNIDGGQNDVEIFALHGEHIHVPPTLADIRLAKRQAIEEAERKEKEKEVQKKTELTAFFSKMQKNLKEFQEKVKHPVSDLLNKNILKFNGKQHINGDPATKNSDGDFVTGDDGCGYSDIEINTINGSHGNGINRDIDSSTSNEDIRITLATNSNNNGNDVKSGSKHDGGKEIAHTDLV